MSKVRRTPPSRTVTFPPATTSNKSEFVVGVHVPIISRTEQSVAGVSGGASFAKKPSKTISDDLSAMLPTKCTARTPSPTVASMRPSISIPATSSSVSELSECTTPPMYSLPVPPTPLSQAFPPVTRQPVCARVSVFFAGPSVACVLSAYKRSYSIQSLNQTPDTFAQSGSPRPGAAPTANTASNTTTQLSSSPLPRPVWRHRRMPSVEMVASTRAVQLPFEELPPNSNIWSSTTPMVVPKITPATQFLRAAAPFVELYRYPSKAQPCCDLILKVASRFVNVLALPLLSILSPEYGSETQSEASSSHGSLAATAAPQSSATTADRIFMTLPL
mmetsp:Transcript_18695/g.57608  ORF Transcript_18695/g.57608 Transcript_18695/m.57608 type:complete len:332 (+) Transcript_18695:576-1571(+)